MGARVTRLFWLLVAGYLALVAWAATVLPERVPMHWSGSGGPDRWGGRTEAVVMLLLVGILLGGVFGALLHVIPRSRSLTWVNVPNKAYWSQPEHVPRALEMTVVDLGVIGSLTMAFLWAIPVSIVQATERADAALPAWLTPVLVGWLVLVGAYLVWLMTVRWRIPPHA